jgi:hypothetical protein
MNNILFYIVFSQHVEFVTFLIQEMLTHVKTHFADQHTTHTALCYLTDLLAAGRVSNEHCVVIFFFFLTLDEKMRHWILNSQQSRQASTIRDALLKKNVLLVPGGGYNFDCNFNNPFLGQHVALQALDPHVAVPILTSIMHPDFFQHVFATQDPTSCGLHETFLKLKRLVMFS